VTHVLVGYWWQNTRLCPVCTVITATQTTSCRTKRLLGAGGGRDLRLDALRPSCTTTHQTTPRRRGSPPPPHTSPPPTAARGRDTASGPSASHPPPATRLVPIAATHAGHPLRRPAHVATPSSRAERLRQARRASGSTPACGTGTPHGRRAAAALRPRRARSVGGAESGGPCSACPWRGSTPASPRRTCTCERSTVPCGVVLPVWVRCPLRSGRGSSPGQGPLAFCLPRLWRPTLRLSRARKPKRRRSVGCRASAVGRRLRAVVRPRATPKTLDQPAPLTRLLLALVWLCCLL